MITFEEVNERYSYNPETGTLWSKRLKRPVGYAAVDGRTSYLSIAVLKGKMFRVHRICWLLHYGEWPKNDIDHIDGNGLNNRIDNLRDVDNTINHRNRRSMSSRNISGITGVFWHTKYRKWAATIGVNNKDVHLGYFKRLKHAAAARTAAEKTHGFTLR